MGEHTALPWIANIEHSGSGFWRIESKNEHGVVNDGYVIAEFSGPDAEQNCKLVRCAVNSHEALVGVVRDALRFMTNDNPVSTQDATDWAGDIEHDLKAALALAEVKP